MTDQSGLIGMLLAAGEEIEKQKLYLTELDNVTGDGDHGINMARGFDAVSKKLSTLEDKDIGTILKTVGMTLVSTVGGASGPLYGTAFMQAGKVLSGKNEIEMTDFLAAFDAAIEGVKMRGKSTVGEKTMLDAMVPARDAMVKAYGETGDVKAAFAAGIEAAEGGIEYTKTIIATKGRASYIGERSLGHTDPGAESFTFMLKAVSERL